MATLNEKWRGEGASQAMIIKLVPETVYPKS